MIHFKIPQSLIHEDDIDKKCSSIISFYTCRELHSMTNYFMLSLAVADLLVCLIIMPCSLMVLLIGQYEY